MQRSLFFTLVTALIVVACSPSSIAAPQLASQPTAHNISATAEAVGHTPPPAHITAIATTTSAILK